MLTPCPAPSDAHMDRGTKRSDVTTLRASVEAILRQHYPALLGRLCLRLVPCPPLCAEALSVLTRSVSRQPPCDAVRPVLRRTFLSRPSSPTRCPTGSL